jgi:2-amino-4-deoxychorismate synthase
MSVAFDTPFCLFHTNGRTRGVWGQLVQHTLLADLPPAGRLPVVSMVPFSQMRERGFAVQDGGEPILSLVPTHSQDLTLEDLGRQTAGTPPPVVAEGPIYQLSNEEFEQRVAAVIRDEICKGEGSNFLISRKGRLQLQDFTTQQAIALFVKLARAEFGAYMTFCFFDGSRFFIGSSPERHITVEAGTVRMNPICGTLPKAALKTKDDLLAFLADPKEINELFQVVDETLKMMSRICVAGGDVLGPYLKEMSALFHTEYVLEGQTEMDPVDAFRASLYAPTMVGSPLESAARVIKRYEPESRRYYSSAIMVREETETGPRLDSAITIRTVEIGPDGTALLQSGASIVRDSVPEKERMEVQAKGAGLLRALTMPAIANPEPLYDRFVDAEVKAALVRRNEVLSRFWTEKQTSFTPPAALQGKRVLIIDNEDQFTEMLAHILTRLGLTAQLSRYDDTSLDFAAYDLVLVGPGPGDPGDLTDPKMQRVHAIVKTLRDSGRPFMAVCLGHQILSLQLGLTVQAMDPPQQGVQNVIDLFGTPQAVGFYNTFFAQKPDHEKSNQEKSNQDLPGITIAAGDDGRILALRGPRFRSFQFHPESVLTRNGVDILSDAMMDLLA